MKFPENHPQESDRLESLNHCEVLGTPAEGDFDGLVQLARFVAKTPISLISLVDKSRQWFKASIGLEAKETARNISFCGHAILEEKSPFIVQDALLDERFVNNPLVTGEPHIRFYLGFPLRVGPTKLPLGTLCVIDTEPRQLNEEQLAQLRILAHQAERHLETRSLLNSKSSLPAINYRRKLSLIETIPVSIYAVDHEGTVILWNKHAEEQTGYASSEILGNKNLSQKVLPDYLENRLRHFQTENDPEGHPWESTLIGKNAKANLISWMHMEETIDIFGWQGVVAFGTDITHQRLREHIISKSRIEELTARIGREIHDGLCQDLVATAYQIQLLNLNIGKITREKASETLDQILKQTSKTLADARRISRGLLDHDSELLPLKERLRLLTASTEEIYGIICKAEIEVEDPVSDSQLCLNFYHIAQEGITNAIKHASPSIITLKLLQKRRNDPPGTKGHLILIVHNDGQPMKSPVDYSHSAGLRLIQYRMGICEGHLSISSSVTTGTTLRCVAPFR